MRAKRNLRVVCLDMLLKFCGMCVSLMLAVPLSRFYTRSMFFGMSWADNKKRAQSPHRKGCDERSEESTGSKEKWVVFLPQPERPRPGQEVCQTFRETECHTIVQGMWKTVRDGVCNKADQGF